MAGSNAPAPAEHAHACGASESGSPPFASLRSDWPGEAGFAAWLRGGGARDPTAGKTAARSDPAGDRRIDSAFPGQDDVRSPSRLVAFEPAWQRPLFVHSAMRAGDVRRRCRVAAQAQRAWAGVAPAERAQVLEAAADRLLDDGETWRVLLARETGTVGGLARYQVEHAARLLRRAAALALEPADVRLAASADRRSVARRLPVGVVGVIAPFNFPLLLAMRSLAPALALGNAVVIKPDPATSVCGGHALAWLLHSAGLPEGLVQVVTGDREAGRALCEDPDVALVCFTGSTKAGRDVGARCGRHLKKAALELGGKNALVVLDDADLDRAAALVARSAWLHQGQVCMAAGRILVPEARAEALVERLVARAEAMPHGDPCDPAVRVGPLIGASAWRRVDRIVRSSVAAGARRACGGPAEGWFYRPTVLDRVEAGMPAYEQEVFGPVAAIVRYRSEADALSQAREPAHGLVAAVLSGDPARARAFGEQLPVGMLHLNDTTIQDDGDNPFGGMGASGNGQRMGGPCDLDLYTQWQWLTVRDALPSP